VLIFPWLFGSSFGAGASWQVCSMPIRQKPDLRGTMMSGSFAAMCAPEASRTIHSVSYRTMDMSPKASGLRSWTTWASKSPTGDATGDGPESCWARVAGRARRKIRKQPTRIFCASIPDGSVRQVPRTLKMNEAWPISTACTNQALKKIEATWDF
jgi:hypothetical protein